MALNIKQITNFSKVVQEAEVIDNYFELDLGQVVKFGYICEIKGIIHPIYLKMDGEYVQFNMGKTGIFEITTDVEITGIKVPVGISFTIDYIVKGE